MNDHMSKVFHSIKNARQPLTFLIAKVKKEGWATAHHIIASAEATLKHLDAIEAQHNRRKVQAPDYKGIERREDDKR